MTDDAAPREPGMPRFEMPDPAGAPPHPGAPEPPAAPEPDAAPTSPAASGSPASPPVPPAAAPGARVGEDGPAPDGAAAPATADPPAATTPRRWRALLAAGAIGALVGALAMAGVDASQRAQLASAAEEVRAIAGDYLTAIAEGRGEDATALAPVDDRAGLLAAPVLAAAERIAAVEVGEATIERDVATVDASFDLDGRPVPVQLRLTRADGAWRLAGTLAEPVLLPRIGSAPRSIAGVAIGSADLPFLYPGAYPVDAADDGLVRTAEATLVVDGRTETPTAVELEAALSEAPADEARAQAVAFVERCAAAPGCPVGAGLLVAATETARLDATLGGDLGAARRVLELEQPLSLLRAGAGAGVVEDRTTTVQLRVTEAPDGLAWECRWPAGVGSASSWEACDG